MSNETNDTVIHFKRDKEIKLNLSFRLILGFSIFLTGIICLAGIIFFTGAFSNKPWTFGITDFLYRALFFVSMFICFAALVSVAITKKPFSRMLVWCIMSIGILFVSASLTFTHISGYKCSGFYIFTTGNFTLIDGNLLMIGLLAMLFSKVIHYGLLYQKNNDSTL